MQMMVPHPTMYEYPSLSGVLHMLEGMVHL
jgi:hypothetical protein